MNRVFLILPVLIVGALMLLKDKEPAAQIRPESEPDWWDDIMYRLGQRSLERLTGVHPDMVRLVKRAIQITAIDFSVGEGVRELERQRELFNEGKTTTLNSRHLTGHAVDLWALDGGVVSWDWKFYHQIADAMKQASRELNIPIIWGGDWTSFKDGPHFELSWEKYPR
ncbi:M15 family metallopeptidase [Aliivibrio kagoshimensis]|uniref:M15 family metallopeptidase n=1 Tax=Aliivibrio kagoshimensis TaxID=2910230 RepID=UPI003D13120A